MTSEKGRVRKEGGGSERGMSDIVFKLSAVTSRREQAHSSPCSKKIWLQEDLFKG